MIYLTSSLFQGLAELKMKLAGIAMQLDTDYPAPREHGDGPDGMMFPDGQGGGQGMMDPQQQQMMLMQQQAMMQGGGMGMGMGGGMMADPYGQPQQQQYGGGGWA